jgi:methionyl-tRNA formyltransferase
VRAVAPPFPGAFAEVGGERWDIHRTRLTDRPAPRAGAWLFSAGGGLYAACGGGGVVRLLEAANDRGPVDFTRLARALEQRPAPLG